jgi:hypothetical protein
MQRAHRRHQPDPLAARPPGSDATAERTDRSVDGDGMRGHPTGRQTRCEATSDTARRNQRRRSATGRDMLGRRRVITGILPFLPAASIADAAWPESGEGGGQIQGSGAQPQGLHPFLS